jgi:hypothetical protein
VKPWSPASFQQSDIQLQLMPQLWPGAAVKRLDLRVWDLPLEPSWQPEHLPAVAMALQVGNGSYGVTALEFSLSRPISVRAVWKFLASVSLDSWAISHRSAPPG